MSKGKKVSAIEQRRWLADHESGKSLDKIAKSAARAPSSIWKGIEAARKERESLRVREGLLREAYLKHFEDLIEETERIAKVAKERQSISLLESGDRRGRILLSALKEHLPDSPLWDACRRWENAAKRLVDTEKETRASIAGLVEGFLKYCKDCPEKDRKEYPGIDEVSFRESLWFAVERGAGGMDSSHMAYKIESFPGGVRFAWGGYGLAAGRADQAAFEEIQKKHTELLEQLADPKSESVIKLREAKEEWGQERDRVEDELEKLLLRHYVPGQCSLCPGS